MPTRKPLTVKAACELLNLDVEFTSDELKTAFRKAAKSAHPDRGGTVEKMQAVNEANTLLEFLALDQIVDEVVVFKTDSAQATPSTNVTLLVSPDGRLFGPGNVYVGNCRTVASAIAYCAAAGWTHNLLKALTGDQRQAVIAAG